MRKHLADAKIDTGIHYPVPLHLQKAYEGFDYTVGDFPVTERVAAEIFSLPMYPQLTYDSLRRVAEKVREFLDGRSVLRASGQLLAASSD